MRSGFFDGINCFLKGLEIFFHSRPLWKYSLGPLLLTFISYILLAGLLFWGGSHLQELIHNWINSLPAWCSFLKYIYSIFHFLTLLLLAAAIFIFTLPPLYELFHGVFSDSLLEEWGKKNGLSFPPLTFRENGIFFLQSLGFSFRTFLCFLLFFPLTFAIPVIGKLLLWIFLSRRLALSLLFPIAFLYRDPIPVVRQKTAKAPFFIMGFGLACSLSLMVPFLFPLFLPAMTLGGAIVYQKIKDEEEKQK